MAYISDKLNVTPSVFDRLLDDSPNLISDDVPGNRRNPPVRVVANRSIELFGLLTIDSVPLVVGDRVLVVAQLPALKNGVYLANEGNWTRIINSETTELIPAAFWDVEEGYEYGKTQWRLVNAQRIVLDTTPIVIEQFVRRSQYQSVKELKNVVARDLEFMFNTHREALFNMTDGYTEASHSLVTYGVPDFSKLDARNPHDRNRVCAILKELINDFEPRLKKVDVISIQPGQHAQNLHFRLDALLEVYPLKEQVVFDAVLQLTTKSYQIKES